MFDGISAVARTWLLIIAMIIAFGGGAAASAKAGGATLGWCIVAGLSAGFGQIVTALMKSPAQARNEQSTTPPRPGSLSVWILFFVLTFGLVMGCATRWVDKIAQTRIAATHGAYRSVAEYNAWLQPRTNNPAAFKTTYGALMTTWTNVDTAARSMGRSALLLENLEDTYRATPTNESAVVAVANELAAQSSNVTAIVQSIVRSP